MNLWHSILFSAFLLVGAVGLMLSHRRSWHRFCRDSSDRGDFDEKELDYRRRQYRRRMQTSAMLAVLALTLPIVDWLTDRHDSALLYLACWGVVLLLVGWLGLLALADLIATRYHFGRMKESYLVEEAKLKAELRKIELTQGDRATEDRGSVAPKDPSSNN